MTDKPTTHDSRSIEEGAAVSDRIVLRGVVYLVATGIPCLACGQDVPVVTFGCSDIHPEEWGSEQPHSSPVAAMLHEVVEAPEGMIQAACQLNPRYGWSREHGMFLNHCRECGEVMDDHDLGSHPGDPFYPTEGEFDGTWLRRLPVEPPLTIRGTYSVGPMQALLDAGRDRVPLFDTAASEPSPR